MARSSGFDKDLGYLFPFIERIERAAAEMEPAAADRLRGLMEGERERWSAVRDVLQGGAAPQTLASRTSAPSPQPKARGWTVGNLKAR